MSTVCPQCGSPAPAEANGCPACGTPFMSGAVATGVLPNDTTGLPPGATFGPTIGATEAPTRGGTATSFTGLTGTDGGAPLKVGSAFGPRYQIISLLGIGGMGAVYQAWDAELSVAVALKVIRSDERRASPETEKQFKNELLLARQVTHKNVVRIHDLGEIDGVKYITMPYVEGDDLATVLRRDGKLPLPRALRLAREIADALCAAHEAGVVHRDLKPANIMISGAGDDAHALIMDFGISASVSDTAAGGVFGTLEYMAPEQGLGERVDGRADIYAFGLILYEMLLGIRAAPQDRYDAMMQRFENGLPAARTLDESIPEPLNALVMRCLERSPDARFQTSAELNAALTRLDDAGEVIHEPRRLTRRHLIAATVIMALIAGGASYVTSRAIQPPAQHDPMPVVIADFDNLANDSEFSGALEQAFSVALERASFITAYPRRDAELVAAQLRPGAARLDETLATLIALHEGIKVVVSGSIARRGSGYRLAVKALDAQGQILTTVTADAGSKDEVLGAVGTLGARVRRALGDTTAQQGQKDTETLTATSLEAVRLYAVGRDFEAKYRDEEALQQYKRATELDPNFGRAYAGWANAAFRLGRAEESETAWKKALSLIDRMTEREKYRTLGTYYGTASHNYDKAIENFATLIRLYPADGAGHNNLALAYFSTLDFQKAREEGKRVLDIYPNKLLYRGNYALYAMYAGDFTTASTQASRIVMDDPKYYPAYLPLAIDAAIRNDFAAAVGTYDRMASLGGAAASTATIGLADLALYQWRTADARTILTRAVTTDTARDRAGLAAKYVLLAETYEAGGRRADARRAALDAVKVSQDLEAALAARVLARVGAQSEAASIAATFAAQLQPQKRAYGKVIEGEMALNQNRVVDAVEALSAARKLADLWIVRFDLGVAYVRAGQYAEAFSELDLARKRQGEATALLLDDRPTLRYLAPLPYWLGRAQEGLGQISPAAANYSAFLALRSDAPSDPLAVDAQRRVKAAH